MSEFESDTPWPGSVVGLVDAYRLGEREPIQELRATIAAIRRSQLNICCFLDQQLVSAVESGRLPEIDLRLPLAGVPFLVKELERVEGWPFSEGCLLLSERTSSTTSTHVARLVAAGAIPIGQSTTGEFGRTAYTATRLHGVTRNPWNPEETPGGSSGGSAAAVAGGIVTFATATDGAGSIRQPASLCGLPGLRVSNRLIPAGPRAILEPLTVVVGTVTRTIRDIARLLDVSAGADLRDPFSAVTVPRFEEGIGRTPLAGRRFATIPDFGGIEVGGDFGALFEESAASLAESCGLERVSVADCLPQPDPVLGLPGAIRIIGLLGDHSDLDLEQLTPEVKAAVLAIRSATPTQLGQIDKARSRVIEAMADMLEQADFIMTPTTSDRPFPAEGPPPPGLGQLGAVNIAGYPAITVPVGYSRRDMPLGLQIIARPFEEPALLELGHRWEQLKPWPLVAPGSPH